MNTRHALIDTALGELTLVASGESITGLYFRNHVRRPAAGTFGREVPISDDNLLGRAATQLREYLAGGGREFELPLKAAGDDFQRSVWQLVAAIPCGQTTTYGAIAERLGDKALAYRVGQAVGANPLCIFVPCHRVVGAGGKLTGYAGGLWRKQLLLELEQPAAVTTGRLFELGRNQNLSADPWRARAESADWAAVIDEINEYGGALLSRLLTDEWLDMCHEAGQPKSTAILVKHGEQDWNALHRDLYGDLVFPL